MLLDAETYDYAYPVEVKLYPYIRVQIVTIVIRTEEERDSRFPFTTIKTDQQ